MGNPTDSPKKADRRTTSVIDHAVMPVEVRAGIIIPWRDSGCEYRRGHHALIVALYQTTGLPIICSTDSGVGPFNASAARNAGVRHLTNIDPGWEAVFLSDADTLTPTAQVWAALNLARDRDWLVIGGDLLNKLDRRSTSFVTPTLRTRLDRGEPINDLGGRTLLGTKHTDYAHGGAAIGRTLWEETGGYDERFIGWGGEDRSYNFATTVLRGFPHVKRIPGPQYHLYHPQSPDTAAHDSVTRQANKALAVRYKRAAGFNGGMAGFVSERQAPATAPDVDAMRGILAELGGPRHPDTCPMGAVYGC